MSDISNRMDLAGKVAVVTGSGRGLGKAMALALAEAGSDVVIVGRTRSEIESAAQEVEHRGKRSLAVQADVSNPEHVDDLVRQSIAKFQKIDILVNNVGGAIIKPLLETTLQEWKTTLDINLTSLFLCCKAVGAYMMRQRRGKIINIASIVGARGRKDFVAYCTSKGGVIQFTRALAMEWVHSNIQVNAIAPGVFYTKPMAVVLDHETLGAIRRKKIPMGREGKPDELGPLVVYLASSASDFMTGETIFIDGGENAKV